MNKLKPAKNYRRINKRCCATCKHWVFSDLADWECKRSPDEIAGDWNANEPEYHVCDLWVKNE